MGALLEARHPFVVPRYQRAYAWEDEAVADFVSDIRALSGSSAEVDEHFFGGLVCIAKTDNQLIYPYSYEVVDGQQRLATLTLALVAVVRVAIELADRAAQSGKGGVEASARTLAEDTQERFIWRREADIHAGVNLRRPRLRLSEADDPVFQQLLEGEAPTPTRESHQLLIAAHGAMLDLARDHAGDRGPIAARVDRLVDLRRGLTERAHVIHIISDDRRQAYRLFSVLNDRGKSLSDADLLRSRSLELLEGHPAEQELVALLWDEMMNAKPKQVEDFFRALYPSIMGKRATGDLYDAIAGISFPPIAPSKAKAAREVVSTVEGFRDELQVFSKLAAGRWPFDRHPGGYTEVRAWQVERLSRLVVTLKHELALPVLLAGAQSLREQDFADLVQLLEIFAFRYKNICNGHAGPPAALYYAQAKAMRDARSSTGRPYRLGPFRAGLRELIEDNAGDQRFREALREKLRYSNPSQRGNIRELLTTLEDHGPWLRRTPPSSRSRPKPSVGKVIDLDSATLEHIYPQKARPADRDEAIEPIKHHLGNLTFFNDHDNVAAANAPFDVKRSRYYQDSEVDMTKELASRRRWTASAVSDREEQLIDDALRVFVV